MCMARKKTRPGNTPDAPPRAPRTYSDLDATRRVLDMLVPGYTPSPGWYTERVDLEEARREVEEVEDRVKEACDALEEARGEVKDAETEAEELAARLEARDATITDLEREKRAVEVERDARAKAADGLRARLEARDETIEDLEARIAVLEARIATLEAEQG